jgi:hypothetical protein
MAHQHPSPDQLDDYLINHLSDVETANVEQHVFACDVCFPRIASRELYDLAVTKACVMLGQLEMDGIKLLTASPLPDGPVLAPRLIAPIIISRPAVRRWEQRYAAIAATVVAGALTFSSVGSIRYQSPAPAVSLIEVPASVRTPRVPDIPVVAAAVQTAPVVSRPKTRALKPLPVFVHARHTRTFLPPNGDVDTPELNLTDVPPPVVAARLQPVALVSSRLPELPKKRVRGSRRVLRALASPFKKIGGALATLAVGDDVTERRTAD